MTTSNGKPKAIARGPKPPASLQRHGRVLWSSVLNDYANLTGAGELEVLKQACTCIDTAERYDAIVAKEGPVIQTKTGARDHPLIRHVTSLRALAARLLHRLGIVEPDPANKRGPGRPTAMQRGPHWSDKN